MIYFLRAEQDNGLRLRAGWIKIGTTICLSVRLKQIAAEIGHIPTLLAVLDGSYAEEHALHENFAGIRARGEWFLPEDVLLQLIENEGRPWDGVDEVTPQNTSPVRLSDEAIKWARIASGYTGESMSAYVSRVVAERGQEDADRLHAQVKKPSKGSVKP